MIEWLQHLFLAAWCIGGLLCAPITDTQFGAQPALTIPQGGTGTSTIPANYVLIGNSNLRITAVPTSTLGITATADGNYSTTSADYWKTQRDFFSTSTTNYWKSTSDFFATTSSAYFLSQYQGAAFSTTSADAFLAQRNLFSTTSTDYWKTLRSFFSTTSADYWETQQSPRGGSGSYPFTPTTNFSTLVQATTGIPWFQNGLHASSTSRFDDITAFSLTLDFPASKRAIGLQGQSIQFDSRNTSQFYFLNQNTINGILDFSRLSSPSKTYFFPNFSGDIAVATSTIEATAFVATSTVAQSFFPYASSTAITTNYASSTLYFGAGLSNCDTENMLTWRDGRFGCESDTTGAGSATPEFTVTFNNTYSTTTLATTTSLWTQGVYFSSSTIATSTFAGMFAVGPSNAFNVFNNGTISAINNQFAIDSNARISKIGNTSVNMSNSAFQMSANATNFLFQNNNSTAGSGIDIQAGTNATQSTFVAIKTGNQLERFRVDGWGMVGVSSSTPSALFSVHATSGNRMYSLFQIGSSTASATTTLFNIDNAGIIQTSSLTAANCDVKASTAGVLSCGTDSTGSTAPEFTVTTLNSFSTTTLATTTSLWTQGVYFSSSTAAASQFPYASSTALTVSGTSYHDLIIVGTTSPIGTGPIVSGMRSGLSNPAAFQAVSFSNTANAGGQLQGYRARGTVDTPLTVNADDSLVSLSGIGWDGGAFGASANGAFNIRAAQTFTSSNKGTYITLSTTPNDTTTLNERVRIAQTGNVGIATTTPWAKLSISMKDRDNFEFPFLIASSTATATTTLFSIDNTGLASTTLLYGAQLSSCTGSGNKLTWAGGTFRCEADQTGAGGSTYPFAGASTFSTTTSATTSSIWSKGVFFSSSTAAASQFPYASSTALTVGKIFGISSLVSVENPSNITHSVNAGDSYIDSYADATGGQTTFDALDATTGGNIIFNVFDGTIKSTAATANKFGILNFSAITDTDKSFFWPNHSGIIAVATGTLQAPAFVSTSTTARSFFPYASSTMMTFSTASSSAYYGGQLSTCTGVANKLTWDAGTFRCEADATSVGGTVRGQAWELLSVNYLAPTTTVGVVIGTTTPTAGVLAGTATSLFVSATSSVTDRIIHAVNQNNETNFIIQNSNGHVGLGNITDLTPNNTLVVNDSTVPGIRLSTSATSDTEASFIFGGYSSTAGQELGSMQFLNSNGGSVVSEIAGYHAATDDNGNGGFVFKTQAVGLGGLIERMRIDQNGNIGIGHTAPSSKLNVQGEAVARYFTATTTLNSSTFPYASTTALSATSLCISSDCRSAWPAGGSGTPEFNVTLLNSFSTTTLATTTSLWTQGIYIASSTLAASQLPYASTTAVTAATASTTALYVSNAPNAIALMGVDGLLGKYGGSSNPCTNQVPTTISTVGALGGCTSINNSWWSGTDLSVANGGTGISTFGGTNTVLYTSAADTLAWDTDMLFDGKKLVVTAASSTSASFHSFLQIPTSTAPLLTTAGQIATNVSTNVASSGIAFYDGAAQRFAPDVRDMRGTYINYPTSGTGTTTIALAPSIHGFTVVGAYCWSMEGTNNKFTARIGTGYSTSTFLMSSTTANGIGFTKLATQAFNAGQSAYVEFGSFTSTGTTTAACNFPYRYDY